MNKVINDKVIITATAVTLSIDLLHDVKVLELAPPTAVFVEEV